MSESNVYDQTANVGLAVNWTLFDGLRIRTNYKRLKEMQQMGALKTRITIEDFMASLTAEYCKLHSADAPPGEFPLCGGLARAAASPKRVRWATSRASTPLQARVDFNAPTVRNTCPSTSW